MEWNVKIEPVIFGEEAILSCKTQVCHPNTRKKWIGGKKYDLLGFDNNTTNPSKYKMMSNGSSVNFDIMIMNFSVSDTNCEYTCACGFLQYTNMLKLDTLDFICKYFNLAKPTFMTHLHIYLRHTWLIKQIVILNTHHVVLLILCGHNLQ